MARILSPEQEIVQAVKRGSADRVRELLAAQPNLAHTTEASGANLLHHAAWKGHPAVVALLLAAGVDVAGQWNDGHVGGTPLHAAAHGNQRAIAELLFQHGADPRAVSCNGRTVMEETRIHNATAVANLLKKHGVEP